jgi:hypothetical protein
MKRQCYVIVAISLLSATSLAARNPALTTACNLLSASDVQEVVQLQSDQGSTRINAGILTSCTFRIVGGGSVSVLLRHDDSGTWVVSQRRRMTGAPDIRPIDGMGGSAFVLDLHDSGAALCVYRGNYYLQVSVVRLGSSDRVLPTVQELARRALANLGHSSE